VTVLIWILAFLAAFVATNLPLGPVYASLHPDFVALLVLYWAIGSNGSLGYTLAWGIGLVQDLILGDLLGAHAMGLVLMLYLLYLGLARVRRLPPWEQLFFIFLLLLAERLVVWLWQGWTVPLRWHWALLVAPAFGAALWPLWTSLLDRVFHRHAGRS